MDFKKSKKLLIQMAIVFLLLAAIIFFVAGDSFRYQNVDGESLSAAGVIGEFTDGTIVEQRLPLPAEIVQCVSIQVDNYGRQNKGIMNVEIMAEDGTLLTSAYGNAADFEEGTFIHLTLQEPIERRRGENIIMRLSTQGSEIGSAGTIYFGNSVGTGRFKIAAKVAEEDLFRINGAAGNGKICAYMSGVNHLSAYRIYWPMVLSAFALMAVICRVWWTQAKKGKNNPLVMICTMLTRYHFLMKQLVMRDFKTKYKRSVLGVGWSFLNPLLTMSVQYVVFSTLFGDGTKNYPVYLLSGIVFFNFFNEAVSMGLTSITGNASLIKKVYIPKYVFPVTRVLSSMINLGTAMIPLLLVMLLSGARPTPALLLLIFDICCLMIFVIGMVLLLSTSMTFFQDTQFLWNVISILWMYLTPLFYTESIIPKYLIHIYRANPMYQYITFARTCIIEGVSPEPIAYVWCLASAALVLLLGTVVFKKNQDKFILQL